MTTAPARVLKTSKRFLACLDLEAASGHVTPHTLAVAEHIRVESAQDWLGRRAMAGEMVRIDKGCYRVGTLSQATLAEAGNLTDDEYLTLLRCHDEPRFVLGPDGIAELLDVPEGVASAVAQALHKRGLLRQMFGWSTTEDGVTAFRLHELRMAREGGQ